MYKVILFDLDGTLTDPKEGITKCVEFALLNLGYSVACRDELTKFIGPPLAKSFEEFYSLTPQETKLAIEKYRERFSTVGKYENKVYSGIVELLSTLKSQKKTLCVATSKPSVYTLDILNKFGLLKFFDIVVGSELDGTRTAKVEVIAEVLRQLNVQNISNVVMVGDRKHDIIGANECKIASIGVEYGYAENGELKKAGATHIVSSVEELKNLLVR